MDKKSILKSIAAAGMMFGGANMLEDGNVVYAAELEEQEKEAVDKAAEELEAEASTSETPSEFLEISNSEMEQGIVSFVKLFGAVFVSLFGCALRFR